MSPDMIGVTVDAIATLAIVLTLGFLGIQIRGETVARRAQTRQDLANARRDGIKMHLTNSELREARFRSRHGEPLTESDEDIFFWYVALLLRDFENFVYQHSLGTLDTSELETARELVRTQLAGEPGFMNAAKEIAAGYATTYTDYMKAELRQVGLEIADQPQ